MRLVLKNSTSNRCGDLQTEPSETSYVELSSANQLFVQTSQSSSQDGKNQSSLADMLMVISTRQLISLWIDQENLRLYGIQKMDPESKDGLSLTSRDQV